MQHAVDTCICSFFRFLPNCAQQADWHELSRGRFGRESDILAPLRGFVPEVRSG